MTSILFDVVLLVLSFYVFVAGIIGRGRLFNIDNIKEGCEELFQKKARLYYILLGFVMVINSLASMGISTFYTYDENYQLTVPLVDLGKWSFLTPGFLRTTAYIALAVMIVLLVMLGVFLNKVIDRNAPSKKSKVTSKRRNGTKDPVSFPSQAFDFASESAMEHPAERPAEEAPKKRKK